MKSIFKKVIFIISAMILAFAICLPCSAQESEQSEGSPKTVEFKFTAPRAIAAGSAVILFAASQIIIYKHTDKE